MTIRRVTDNSPASPTIAVEAPPLTYPPVRQRVRPALPLVTLSEDPPPDNDTKSGYTVGYGKPPRNTQFKAGKSGNPRGRPKAAKSLKTIVREALAGKILVRTTGGQKKMSRIEAVVHKTIELGMKGNPRALTQLIALYASAVPEAALPLTAPVPMEDLSATDLAMLEELRASWLAEQGEIG